MIANMGVAQRVRQFDTQHGDDPVRYGSYLLFADGARREINPEGALLEPPRDPHERAKLAVVYREGKLQRVVEEFTELKQRLTFKAKEAIRHAAASAPPPPPSDDELAELRRLQSVVQQRQRALEDARTAADAAKPVERQQHEAAAVANCQQYADVLTEIEATKI